MNLLRNNNFTQRTLITKMNVDKNVRAVYINNTHTYTHITYILVVHSTDTKGRDYNRSKTDLTLYDTMNCASFRLYTFREI